MNLATVRRALGAAALLLVVLVPAGVAAPFPTDTTPPPTDTALPPTDTDIPSEVPVPTDTALPPDEPIPTETSPTTTYFEEDLEVYDDEGAAVCAGCAALGIALPLIVLGISIAIALWIYRDAKERNIASAALWAILGFLFNLLGLIIYLIARKNMSGPPPAAQAPPPPPNVPPPAP